LRSLTHYLPTFIDDLKEHDPDGYRKLRKKDPGFLREVAERKKESRGGN